MFPQDFLGMIPLRSLCSNALLSFAESTGQNSVKYSNACKVAQIKTVLINVCENIPNQIIEFSLNR